MDQCCGRRRNSYTICGSRSRSFWGVRWRAAGRDSKQSSRSFDRKRDADLFESDRRRRRRQLGQLPTSEATTQTLENDLDPTTTRPAEDAIRDRRAAGVPTVFPPSERSTTEKVPEGARLQAKHEALSGDRTQDPLLTMEVLYH